MQTNLSVTFQTMEIHFKMSIARDVSRKQINILSHTRQTKQDTFTTTLYVNFNFLAFGEKLWKKNKIRIQIKQQQKKHSGNI